LRDENQPGSYIKPVEGINSPCYVY